MTSKDEWTIDVLINDTTKTVTIGTQKKSFEPKTQTKLTFGTLGVIASEKDGFDGLVEELKRLAILSAKTYQIEWKVGELLGFIAISTITRMSHLEARMKIPRFIAKQIQDILIAKRACEMSNGGLKKYGAFAAYLIPWTVDSVVRTSTTMAANQFRYTLPLKEELFAMSEEMLLEEIRVCSDSRGKHKTENLAILREMLTNKRKEEVDGKQRLSDIELLKSIAREDAAEDQRTTTPKKKQKNKTRKGTKRR
jgi:hypothetical protein